MLKIVIPETELFNEDTYEIIKVKRKELTLEHSLLSISKWESKYKKPFLTKDKKTAEEVLEYIKCMTITQNVDQMAYLCLTKSNIDDVTEYIKDPMTATTFYDSSPSKQNKETVTSELIYYWMVASNIPVEFERWHINRLLTLIRICSIKNDPNPKKMSRQQVLSQNAALNKARRAALGSKG